MLFIKRESNKPVVVSGITFTQAYNHHIMGRRDGKMIFHGRYHQKLSRKELKNYGRLVVELLTDSE